MSSLLILKNFKPFPGISFTNFEQANVYGDAVILLDTGRKINVYVQADCEEKYK